MQLKLLGTGNAAGMPLYGCECPYCQAAQSEPSLKRGPCSAVLTVDDKHYLIDAGQVNLHERFKPNSIKGIFVTHFHPDHVQGLFHLRWGIDQHIPVYAPPDSEGCADLYKHPGILDFQPQKKFEAFRLGDLSVTPLPLIHSKPTLGYLFEYADQSIAYLTDTKGLPPKTLNFLREAGLDLMVVDCTYPPGFDGKGHNNLDDVYELTAVIRPGKTVLTHIGHDLDVWLHKHRRDLPANISSGVDGLQVYPYRHV